MYDPCGRGLLAAPPKIHHVDQREQNEIERSAAEVGGRGSFGATQSGVGSEEAGLADIRSRRPVPTKSKPNRRLEMDKGMVARISVRAIIAVGLFVLLQQAPVMAQTTYNASNVPFLCDAATSSRVPLTFGMFACRGLTYYDANNKLVAELFFWGSGRIELFTYNPDGTANWSIGPYNASLSETSFSEPNPPYCDTINQFCSNGVTLGTFAFNWSGTDGSGNSHNGSVSGTWFNRQGCGGKSCWYHPVLETAPLTINQ